VPTRTKPAAAKARTEAVLSLVGLRDDAAPRGALDLVAERCQQQRAEAEAAHVRLADQQVDAHVVGPGRVVGGEPVSAAR